MTLTELFTNIANAIRGKDGTTATIAPTDFASRISAIETGTQLPTLSNQAVAGEIASGKQAIDANGNVLTGTAYVNGISTYYMDAVDTTHDSSNDVITSWGQVSKNTFMYTNSVVAVKHSSSDFGDATAADVANGKTFTSSAGLKVTGSVVPYDSGTGLVVNAQSRAKSGNNLATMATNSSDSLLRSGSTIMINDPLTNFGDATAADVANGKTFTSSAGLKVTGTGTLKQAGDIVASKVLSSELCNYSMGSYSGWKLTLDTPISNIKAFSVSAEYNNDSIDPDNGAGTIAGIYTQGTNHIGMVIEYIDGNNEWGCVCHPMTCSVSSDGYTVTCIFGKSLGNIGAALDDYGSVSGYVSGTYKA